MLLYSIIIYKTKMIDGNFNDGYHYVPKVINLHY